MKGTDVPHAEIENAENFLKASHNWPLPERFIQDREKFLRLLAWYGAIRSNGDSSGYFVTKPRKRDSSVPGKEAAHDGGCEVVSTGTPETGAAVEIGGSAQTWALIHKRLDEYNARVGRVRRTEEA